MLTITNHGPLIVATNYWGSALERRGLVFVSTNAGAIRLLLPRAHEAAVAEMRSAAAVVVARGPWPDEHLADAVEIMFDDGSPEPWVLHVGPESLDRLPLDDDAGRALICTVWVHRRGRPHKALEKPAWYRGRVPVLPWLRPWSDRTV